MQNWIIWFINAHAHTHRPDPITSLYCIGVYPPSPINFALSPLSPFYFGRSRPEHTRKAETYQEHDVTHRSREKEGQYKKAEQEYSIACVLVCVLCCVCVYFLPLPKRDDFFSSERIQQAICIIRSQLKLSRR